MRERETFSVERRAANGNYIAYACGPLRRPRYINEKIEEELVEFKKEIEEKFAASKVNKEFKYPRLPTATMNAAMNEYQLKKVTPIICKFKT
jgi:hypothetical protein